MIKTRLMYTAMVLGLPLTPFQEGVLATDLSLYCPAVLTEHHCLDLLNGTYVIEEQTFKAEHLRSLKEGLLGGWSPQDLLSTLKSGTRFGLVPHNHLSDDCIYTNSTLDQSFIAFTLQKVTTYKEK